MSKMLGELGNIHQSLVDPAGILPDKMSDPLGLASRKKKQVAAAPAPAPADPAMPTPDDEAVEAARRRKVAAMQQRGGRASTILTSEEKLGG